MDSELIDGTIHRKLGFLPLESTGFWPILVNFALKPNRGFTCCRGCHCSGIFRAEYLSSGEPRWAAVGIEGRAHGPNGKGEVNLVTYAQGTKDLKVQSLPNNRKNIKKAIRIQAGTSQVAEDGRGGCKCHTLWASIHASSSLGMIAILRGNTRCLSVERDQRLSEFDAWRRSTECHRATEWRHERQWKIHLRVWFR